MKVVHLSTYDFGGAANAAMRLHEGLVELGIDSHFVSKLGRDDGQRYHRAAGSMGERIWAKYSGGLEFHIARVLHPTVRPVLAEGLLPGIGLRRVAKLKPDVVNLHWVEHGMVPVCDLHRLRKLGCPIVWTLHDMAPISGGFGYRESVALPPSEFGPLTALDQRRVVSQAILDRRIEAMTSLKVMFVAPSHWLAEEARRSPVSRGAEVHRIPYGVNTERFRPMDRHAARRALNLSEDRSVVLFGYEGRAAHRKGTAHLFRALRRLKDRGIVAVGFGGVPGEDLPDDVVSLGRLSRIEEMRTAYCAADVFVCPSREDNLPNTILESLACGTPVAGFRVGGIPDLLDGRPWGRIATPFDEEALAVAIDELLEPNETRRSEVFELAREFALRELAMERQAERYLELYTRLTTPGAQLDTERR